MWGQAISTFWALLAPLDELVAECNTRSPSRIRVR